MTRSPMIRWILPATVTVVGVVLVVTSFVTPWFDSSISVFEGQGSYETQTSELPLGDIEDWWALTYQVAVSVLVVLLVLAMIGTVRTRMIAGVAALVTSLVVAAMLIEAWIDVLEARRTFLDKAEELQSQFPNDGYVLFSTGQTGLVVATIAWVALALAALIALRRARSARATSAVTASPEQSG